MTLQHLLVLVLLTCYKPTYHNTTEFAMGIKVSQDPLPFKKQKKKEKNSAVELAIFFYCFIFIFLYLTFLSSTIALSVV